MKMNAISVCLEFNPKDIMLTMVALLIKVFEMIV
jgi:hypothetical protein